MPRPRPGREQHRVLRRAGAGIAMAGRRDTNEWWVKIAHAFETHVREETRFLAAYEELCQGVRSEEHTSELQSLMRISYAVFCLKKQITDNTQTHTQYTPYT